MRPRGEHPGPVERHPCRFATLGVFGNHDRGPGWHHGDVADRLSQILRSAGISVLRNEVRGSGELQIAGLDDLWAGRFDPKQAFRGLDPRRPALSLSHNPDPSDKKLSINKGPLELPHLRRGFWRSR